LYLFIARWLGWSALLLPALAAVNLAIGAITALFIPLDLVALRPISISTAALGTALGVGALGLERAGQPRWNWPLYLVAAVDVAAAYLTGLFLGGALAVVLSAMFATLAFWLAWAKREIFAAQHLPPILSYLGTGLIFAGHFYLLNLSTQAGRIWPVYTIALCGLFVGLAWLLRRGDASKLYGTPLHSTGLALTVVPLLGAQAVSNIDSPLIAVTAAIAGGIYTADAVAIRNRYLGYLGGTAFIIAYWATLLFFAITELQAYALPLGFGLLALGWNEHRLNVREAYRATTLLGLLALMGTAFFQSLDGSIYALILLLEGLAAIGWGTRVHSRGYVRLGILSLVVNALAQFGPAFVDFPRWVQLGSIGTLLLAGGILALFMREQLLVMRRAIAGEWKRWEL
jgi:hypothetical protein